MSLTRRQLTGVVIAALALLAALDFWQRIHVPRHVEIREAGSFAPVAVPPPATSAAIRRDLATWLPKLQPIADGSPAGEVATGSTLTLLAVFDDREGRFAVVRSAPAAGGVAAIVRIEEGGEVAGFRVARIEPSRVVLAGPDGERALQLFKPAAEPVVGEGPPPAQGPPVAQAAPPATDAPPVAAPAATPAGPPAAAPQREVAASPPAGTKAAPTQEVKPGNAFELPASMRGMKVVEAPSEGVVATPGPPVAAPPPQKP